jgi:hypothetical protein
MKKFFGEIGGQIPFSGYAPEFDQFLLRIALNLA